MAAELRPKHVVNKTEHKNPATRSPWHLVFMVPASWNPSDAYKFGVASNFGTFVVTYCKQIRVGLT